MALSAAVTGGSGVPYYSQWESPELAGRFIDGSLRPAEDPRWAASGARSPAEYEYWSTKACGLACLKMILASRGMPVPPLMRLVERALAWRAYLPQDGRVLGLIYRPFADWARHDYQITAQVAADLPLDTVTAAASPATPVIASVHRWVRWPQRTPPDRGGHLVLVTGAAGGLIRLSNPSGIPGSSQHDTLITTADFAKFYAARGLIITG